MMLSKVEPKNDDVGNSSSHRLLNDIEHVNKCLNLHRKSLDYAAGPTLHRSKSNVSTGDILHKDKKSSIWKKPWKALSHIRNQRFDCWFFLHVSSIEGLPSDFDDTNIRVHWKRKNVALRTRPAKVSQGKALFGETLMHRCSVYGGKDRHHNLAKYEPKVFLLYALVVEATAVDMGKHRIDLTKLLPLTLEELGDKKSSGKWTSSFKLGGRATGGVLKISFGFSVRPDNLLELGNSSTIPMILRESKSNLRIDAVDVARDSDSGRLRKVENSASNSKRYLLVQSESLDKNHLRENKPNTTDAAVDGVRKSSSGRLQSLESLLPKLERIGSSTSSSNGYLVVQSKSFNSKLGDGVVSDSKSELTGSICLVYEKVDKSNTDRLHKSSCEDVKNDCLDTNIIVTEKEVETSSKVQLILEGPDKTSGTKTTDVKEIFEDDGMTAGEDKSCDLIGEISFNSIYHAVTGDTKQETNDKESNDVKVLFEDNGTVVDEWKGFNPKGEDYCINDDLQVSGRTTYQGNDICNKVSMLENSEIEIIDVNEIFKDDEIPIDGELVCYLLEKDYSKHEDHPVIRVIKCEENDATTKALTIQKIDLENHNLSVSELGDPESLLGINKCNGDIYTNDKPGKMPRSISLDDSVANDFLRSLDLFDQGADSEPESPRELLLRQYEKEALSSGDCILNYNSGEENVDIRGDDLQLSLVIRANDKDDALTSFAQSLRIKKDAELLEYMETEALMEEWGFNENVFQNSPCSSGFGSPVFLPVEEPVKFPSLGEGLGSTIRTKDGGFLRSMSPLLFKNAKNGGNLIMQVSSPVVLPAAMGSSIVEILQHWASVGYDKMHTQVGELMPLEDISGKMLQQVAWELASRSEATERLPCPQQEAEDGNGLIGLKSKLKETPFSWGREDFTSTVLCDDVDIDYVSFEGLAPLVMDKVETMSIEGLKIQSGVAADEAPSVIGPQPFGGTSTFLSKSVMVYGSPVLENIDESESEDQGDDFDELIGLSLKLDEWMRLDAGVFEDEDEDGMSERISKIMDAHLNGYMECDSPTLIRDKSTGKSCGLLGNHFTVALRVQLRDPLRDYETVGSSMISLVEVERVYLDPKPIIHCRVSSGDDNDENYAIFDRGTNESNPEERTITEEATPLFKITEVHVAGFSTEPVRTLSTEHSGFRWLVASGMAKRKKLVLPKKNVMMRSDSWVARTTQPNDSIWSISSHVHSPGAKWKEMATMNAHIRNPDVTFLS